MTYDYDPVIGKIFNGNVFNNVDDPSLGYPDGLYQDTDGGVWSARWQAGKVVRFNAHGDITLVIEFPRAYNMTSCIFGGPGMDELYVPSASAATSGDSVEQYPDSGHLYVVRELGYTGEERTRWKDVPPV